MVLIYDDAQKLSMSWSFTHVPMDVLEEQKRKKQSNGTGVVPTKDPPKVKSVIKDSSRTQEC